MISSQFHRVLAYTETRMAESSKQTLITGRTNQVTGAVSNEYSHRAKLGFDACISSRITTIIHVTVNIKSMITALINHSQYDRVKSFY